jgi:hypothetical protein
MQNQRIPKQFATATMEGIRKKGRPHKIQRDGIEENLNIIGIKKQAGNGHRLGMKRDYTGSQSPQHNVALEKKKS